MDLETNKGLAKNTYDFSRSNHLEPYENYTSFTIFKLYTFIHQEAEFHHLFLFLYHIDISYILNVFFY